MSDSAVITARADRDRFSLHPEDDVTETPPHRKQVFYIETNVRRERPELFVGANLAVYWVEGQFVEPWVGPDVLVSQRPMAQPRRVYLVWEDGPIRFVAEVASERTRRNERRKRNTRYRVDLEVPEYLYIDLDRHQLELSRLRDGEYEPVAALEGRLYSEQVKLWFGWGPERNFVRIWNAVGRMLPTPEELYDQLLEAEARADALAAELARVRGATDTDRSNGRAE